MKTIHIREPELYFQAGQTYHDPKVGLLKYGPHGLNSTSDGTIKIKVGIVATHKYLTKFKAFLDDLHSRLEGALNKDTGMREPDFPGLGCDKPLRFDIEIDKSAIEIIDDKEIEELEKYDRKERVVRALDLYKQKLQDLASADPKPNLVFLPLSQKLFDLCKEPNLRIEKIKYARRTFKNAAGTKEVPLFDFHNALKVAGYSAGGFATQLIRPSTLKFQGGQDPATTAWNFIVSAYYKGTQYPWKLADIDDDTCYAGISFFQDFSGDTMMMRASLAQVYLRTGESQVIRGKPFKWNGQGKSPALDGEHAKGIIKDILELYKRHKSGKLPKRVVIHKTSPFVEEEINGFDSVLKNIETVDYVHIQERRDLLVMPTGEQYPTLRGTLIYDEKQKKKPQLILFTTGFVPALQTYAGSTVPNPLLLTAYRLDSDPKTVAKDILALTKLDWNSCDYNTKQPVTISVSEKVGEILAELSASNVPLAQNYRYYM